MKAIKHIGMLLIAATSISMSSCKKTETKTEFSNLPIGTVTTLKTGNITQQNAPGTPPTSGSLSILQDAEGNQFLKLNTDFTSGFSTGTVAVYFAKTNQEIGVQRNGGTMATNVKAVGFVNRAGEQYLPLPATGSANGFSYVVFYCETAEVNFGSAPLN